MSNRTPIPEDVLAEVLTRSARRCCFCFGIEGDFAEKDGQVAHVNRDAADARLDNLAWLCLQHHDRYDSRTSQSKGLTQVELIRYRDMLHEVVARWRTSRGPQEPQPLRSRLRALIHQINPKVLDLLDSGAASVHVTISVPNLMALHQLESERGFSDLMRARPTGATIVGGFGNRVGNAINDINEGGVLQGYLLEPSPAFMRERGA